jgi:hypothetical protein
MWSWVPRIPSLYDGMTKNLTWENTPFLSYCACLGLKVVPGSRGKLFTAWTSFVPSSRVTFRVQWVTLFRKQSDPAARVTH